MGFLNDLFDHSGLIHIVCPLVVLADSYSDELLVGCIRYFILMGVERTQEFLPLADILLANEHAKVVAVGYKKDRVSISPFDEELLVPGCRCEPTLLDALVKFFGEVLPCWGETVQVSYCLDALSGGDLVPLRCLDVDWVVRVRSCYQVCSFQISSPHHESVFSGDGDG